MPRIVLIPKHRAEPDLRHAYGRVVELWGLRANPPVAALIVQCFCHRPRMVEEVARGYFFVGWAGRLPRTVRELAAVLVSRENACFY